jgi:mRNA-degrading endonuclease toxin of MazEF toxin-antitoxin module
VNGEKGQIMIDQISLVDTTRLIKKISTINEATSEKMNKTILNYFN